LRAELHKKAPMLASKTSVTVHYKLGTGMNMTDSMTPTDFSRTFGMRLGRTKWANSVVELTLKPASEIYSGLYIRWLYPSCPNVKHFDGSGSL